MNVLLTHGEGRLEGLEAVLVSAGFEVRHTPLIRTEPLPAVAAHARALLGCDWLLFTSRSAVSAWTDLGLPLAGIDPKIGVVGDKTREAVAERGGVVALTAQPANAQGLLETFLARVREPTTVGLPCGEGALSTLPDGLERAGFSVLRVPLYRTVPRPLTELNADIVVLASPSAVAALPETIPDQTQFIALGPSTLEALTERGLKATMSKTPAVSSVVQAVVWAAAGDLE